MTGTAQTSAEEFHKVYKLEVMSISTNKPLIRNDMNDLIYKNFAAKYRAAKNIDKEELAAITKELKGYWKNISRHVAKAVKPPAKKKG